MEAFSSSYGGEGKHRDSRFEGLSPPAFFSRRLSRSSFATTLQSLSSTTMDDDARNPPSFSDASLPNSILKKSHSLYDFYKNRKEILKSDNLSRSMPCLREIRRQYNRNIGISVSATEPYSDHPLYDQWFTTLALAADGNEDALVIDRESYVSNTVQSMSLCSSRSSRQAGEDLTKSELT
jgi:hypothetical protein